MSILRYTRFGTAALFAFMCGFILPACLENTQAAEYDDLSYRGYDLANTSIAALEEPPIVSDVQSREPFGLTAPALVKGGVQDKWRSVRKPLPREHAILARCRSHAAACPPAAKRFLAILDQAQTHEGWARIAEINRAINLDIKPVDDMTQYGVIDLWATPLMAFKSNEGDCEDYAIAKYVALHELGIALSDLRLVVVHVEDSNEDHAVAAIRYDGRWLVLDNRTLEMRHDIDISDYDPLFVIDGDGAKRVVAWGTQPEDAYMHVDPASFDASATAGWSTVQAPPFGLDDWRPASGQIDYWHETTRALGMRVSGRDHNLVD